MLRLLDKLEDLVVEVEIFHIQITLPNQETVIHLLLVHRKVMAVEMVQDNLKVIMLLEVVAVEFQAEDLMHLLVMVEPVEMD